MRIKLPLLTLCFFAVISCSKDDTNLTGTRWGTTIQQVSVVLSFTTDTNGTLTYTTNGIPEVMTFTYQYTHPEVILYPTDPVAAAEYPNGIKGTVHDKVISCTELIPGEKVTLTKM